MSNPPVLEPEEPEATAAEERKIGSGAWHRLHPLSPFVRAGRALIALAVVLLPRLMAHDAMSSFWELGVVTLTTLVGIVSWLVTRWRVEAQELRIETGLIKRSSLRFPLTQIQAIDIVRPGLARIFGLAELRLRMGGSTGRHARLAYLPEHDAELLRARLLVLAQGTPGVTHATDERVVVSLPTGRLIGSILLSRAGVFAELLIAAIIVTAFVAPDVAAAAIGGQGIFVFALLAVAWQRFNSGYRLTVAEAPDGLRVRSGLIALSAETIRPGRVQAVRMTEPLLWRVFGWCRLEVDVAGRQRRKGEGKSESRPMRVVLPAGSRRSALDLLERILPGAPEGRLPPPRRARLKSPLLYHYLSWSRTDRCVVATSGRIRRVTVWVPLVKVQSLRRIEGPVQRRLRLATIHLDTAGRNVHATLRDRDTAEANEALADLIDLCRKARAAA